MMERMSPKQRERFKARGIEHPTTTFLPPSSPPKSTPRRADTGPDQAAVDAVIDRDGSCVVCGEISGDERGLDWSIHHRKKRSQGGDNRLSNLVLVCGNGAVGCHSNIHGSSVVAYRAGWLVRRDEDPASMVMAHKQLGYVRLNDVGKWTPADPPDGA